GSNRDGPSLPWPARWRRTLHRLLCEVWCLHYRAIREYPDPREDGEVVLGGASYWCRHARPAANFPALRPSEKSGNRGCRRAGTPPESSILGALPWECL